ncbi:MAG: 2-oxo acid dehydrogenase subunit E2, partial [Pseudomonadota bacterium]
PKGEHLAPAPAESAAPRSSPPGGGGPRSGGGDPPAQASDGARIFASPLARRIAAQKNLDLATLKGSGPHGRIIKRDVEGAAPGAAKAPATAGAAASAPRQVLSLAQMGIPDGSYDLVPLDGMRKTVARRLTDSFRDVPHFPLTIDLEIDALLAGRTKINAMLEKQGVKVSVNDLVIKACAIALKQVPEANASYSPEGIAMHHHADIAMAVAIDGGLITPIIRAAETKGLAAIATEAKDLAARARTRKLKPEEFQGGTFSVSNLGMFGIKAFASILNEPQGAILSVGAGEQRPVVKNGQLAIATVMTVTLTCDHRVVDGAIGARWLQAFKGLIEDPITMIV